MSQATWTTIVSRRHGLGRLSLKPRPGRISAVVLFAGPRVSIEDNRFEYGEVREIAFGLINDRVFVCVHADGRTERRVISLRKASKLEMKHCGENLE